MKKRIAYLLIILMCAGLIGGPGAVTRCDDADYGVEAYRLLRIINDNYARRINSTATQSTAPKTAMLQWIDDTMASYGYSVHSNLKGNNFEDPTPVYSHTSARTTTASIPTAARTTAQASRWRWSWQEDSQIPKRT